MNREYGNVVDEKVVEEKLKPTMEIEYLVEVTDKDGKVLQRISAPARSFVRQWYDLMSAMADNVAKTITDTDGVARAGTPHAQSWFALAWPGVTLYGHRIGKGTTAVTISDYALEAPLEEGVGLDQFEHQASTYGKPAVVASSCSFWLRRSMINNTGNTISAIREIGIYTRFAASYYMLGVRDVLPGAVAVPDGGAITVTYTIGVTV